jgi:hypothetical protein
LGEKSSSRNITSGGGGQGKRQKVKGKRKNLFLHFCLLPFAFLLFI